jgi:hypothetical protein
MRSMKILAIPSAAAVLCIAVRAEPVRRVEADTKEGGATTTTATIVDIATDASDPLNLADTEPSIAVNPRDPNEIAVVSFSEPWSATDPSVMAPVWKSRDGGTTWQKIKQIPRPAADLDGPGDQKVIYDANGRLFVAELGIPVAGTTKDYVYHQAGGPDGALTPGMAFGDDQPHLEVDPNAGPHAPTIVYAPWLNTTIANNRSMDDVSHDLGVNETDVIVGDNSAFPNRTTRVALCSDGKFAYIVYKTREGAVDTNFEKARFHVKRSDDHGATWGALGATGVTVHPGQVTTFFTNNFGNVVKGKVARARSSDGWIAVDPTSGEVYVAYVNKDDSGFGQIFVGHSKDNGQTWTTNRVTDGKHHSAYPEIAVAKNGGVGVLYIDYDDSGTETIFRHRFARSFNKGAVWTDQILQSLNPGPLGNAASGFLWGDYNGLTAHHNTFYGVFTGQSIGRTQAQLDPIFFKEKAAP